MSQPGHTMSNTTLVNAHGQKRTIDESYYDDMSNIDIRQTKRIDVSAKNI